MTGYLIMMSQIWPIWSQIWPDFAKSEILDKSEIWKFQREFNGLKGRIQIWHDPLTNLKTNLDYINDFSSFRQIPDLSESTPKGVGDLPAKRGRSPPTPGNPPRPKSWVENDPTTAAPYRQAPDRRRLPPQQPSGEGANHG